MIFSNGAVKLPLVSLNLLFYKKNGNPCLGGAVWSLYTFKNSGFNFRRLLMLLILRLVSNTAYGQYKKVMKMFIDALYIILRPEMITYPWLRSFSVLSSHIRTWNALPSRTCVKMSSILIVFRNSNAECSVFWTFPCFS